LLGKSGEKVILLGNEAIVRAALESGVQFVSTYPGTPASEIGNLFYELSQSRVRLGQSRVRLGQSRVRLGQGPNRLGKGFLFEFSVNEKIALEAGMGASFSGLKVLVAMKNFGANVCQDALLPLMYSGSLGPMVILVADDPSCHSSAQSEENSRFISYLGHIPMLEPADPAECLEFTKLAFVLSQKFKTPVIIRTTTRVSHQRAIVKLGKFESKIRPPVGEFVKDKEKFVTLPPRVLEMKKELLEKIEKIRDFAEKSSLNRVENERNDINQKIGIITSSVSYLYVLEALKELKTSVPILKLGFFYPLPRKKIERFIRGKKKVLVVEELEPILEKEARELAKEVNPKLEILGKNLLSEVGELKPESITVAIAKLIKKRYNIRQTVYNIRISRRHPQPCPGCPYWLVFGALRQAVNPEKVIWGGDIGCYMLAGTPIIDLQDYLFCMGSSLGIGHGIKKASQQKLIAFIGDSTFFHSGIPALINTVINRSNPLIIILDNRTTAMTGHQPSPGEKIAIEEIVKACGVKNIKVLDPANQKEMIEAVKDFLDKEEVSVIISRHPCLFVK